MNDCSSLFIDDKLRVLKLCLSFKCEKKIVHEHQTGSHVNLDLLTVAQLNQIVKLIDSIPEITDKYKI